MVIQIKIHKSNVSLGIYDISVFNCVININTEITDVHAVWKMATIFSQIGWQFTRVSMLLKLIETGCKTNEWKGNIQYSKLKFP